MEHCTALVVMVVTRARLSDPGDQQRSFQDQQNSRPGIIGSPAQPSPAQASTQHCLHLGIETQLGVGTRVLQFGHGFMDAQEQLYLQYLEPIIDPSNRLSTKIFALVGAFSQYCQYLSYRCHDWRTLVETVVTPWNMRTRDKLGQVPRKNCVETQRYSWVTSAAGDSEDNTLTQRHSRNTVVK